MYEKLFWDIFEISGSIDAYIAYKSFALHNSRQVFFRDQGLTSMPNSSNSEESGD